MDCILLYVYPAARTDDFYYISLRNAYVKKNYKLAKKRYVFNDYYRANNQGVTMSGIR